MSMQLDTLFPYKFLHDYWYSQGSIIHFGRQYWKQYGFWKVDGKILVRVDMEGQEILPLETDTIPTNPRGWHLVHKVPNRFIVQPALISYNAKALEIYMLEPDEVVIERERLAEEDRQRRVREYDEWYASATPLMRKMRSFDWSFKMADQSYPDKYRQEDEIIAELETLPYEEALDLMAKYGGGQTDGSDKPDYRKCPGFKYPDVALVSYSYKDHKKDCWDKWSLVRNGVEDVIYDGPARRYKYETDHLGIIFEKYLKTGLITLDTPIFTDGRQWLTVGGLEQFKKKDQAA
ncbi:hypothetical protein EVB97_014 [Rhizobium phage RHph_Y65]|uniref:Uncharacterized protein n=1 Tax=Rhizobium phage RHph_Y65 TaxID=2509785 RepID=A0A7S5R7K8_9CAUD|nr:hypothetical protein PQC17_gp014 [Rhizobium phage RHph_Y65]QIG72572.1 hypothetical protein EVB97_014 [Rhizobium phage RHph_Y65]